ncbi:MAG TPA: glycoside hydrolase family 9 protein [Chitinophagaceae bacterium]|nr:glycoside hydrolase family 9 protein [Chitinophagaceae bacterium]
MKNILILASLFAAIIVHAQTADNVIRINQLGYYVYAPKIAIIADSIPADDFYIVSATKKDTLFKGQLSAVMQSANSSLKTRVLDFTAFHSRGTYLIAVPGLPFSFPFTIGNNANHAVATASLKGFYYQRVSMPLEAAYAGKWARPAGHPDNVVFIHPAAATDKRPAGTAIATPGGWYDAGDYNKYIVNAGITMGTLLSAYEDFPLYFDTLNTSIPESKDALPDILNEALYNLRWMLTMQDPNDGGVYNKCTNASFDGMVMPGITRLPRYVVPKGTAATLDFAAVMAQCSRIAQKMKKQLPGLSDTCLQAAEKAWQWALKNPALVYDQAAMNKLYEIKITTGGYGDREFSDEWFWAAAELYVTTKDKQYRAVLTEKMNDSMVLPSWGHVRMLGYYTLLRNEKKIPKELAADIQHTKERLLQFADAYLLPVKENAFQTVMGRSKRDFNWGSNSNAANQGIALVNAYFISKDKKYADGALSNLDYIMGRNATGYCFVTGLGTRSTMHPHHRPSVADGIAAPVPGLLAGGPNPGMQDKCHYDFTEPETAYADIDCAYASNEIAINWNAPLVYLANAIEALQFELKYSSIK